MQNTLNLILEKIVEMDNKLNNLDIKVTNLDDKVNKLDAKVNKLDDKVYKLDEKVSALDSRVSNLENEVSKLSVKTTGLEAGQKEILRVLNNVQDQTANLTEFETETRESLGRIEYKINRTDNDVINLKNNFKVIK